MKDRVTHWLRYTMHEDEAQKTGMAFSPNGDGTVDVWTTFSGYPDAESDSLKTVPVVEATALYCKLIDEPYPWPEAGIDNIWVVSEKSTSNEGCHPQALEHGQGFNRRGTRVNPMSSHLKMGDIVRHTFSQNGCQRGTIVKILDWWDEIDGQGGMVRWDCHGEVCYSPLSELEKLESPVAVALTAGRRKGK